VAFAIQAGAHIRHFGSGGFQREQGPAVATPPLVTWIDLGRRNEANVRMESAVRAPNTDDLVCVNPASAFFRVDGGNLISLDLSERVA